MWRYLIGSASTLALMAAGFFLVQSMAGTSGPIPPPPAQEGQAADQDPDLATPMRFLNAGRGGKAAPPTATDLSKEEKRFNRYDKDKNGAVSKDEYFVSRKKAYAKLDVNGDGVLSFNEYAVKATAKFSKADSDKSGVLTRTEFSSTRVIRKAKPKIQCPKPSQPPSEAPDSADDAEAG
jgi:uncharacterized protein YxeA